MTKKKLPPKKTVGKAKTKEPVEVYDPKPEPSDGGPLDDNVPVRDNKIVEEALLLVDDRVKLNEGLQDLDAKVIAGITIAHKPTIVICAVPKWEM